MRNTYFMLLLTACACLSPLAIAQTDVDSRSRDAVQLKIAAIEALIAAPPQRALPIVTRVLRGDDSDEVKESALFVLSQTRLPEAQALLLDLARSGSGDLRTEAVRMIGIQGDPDALANLASLYRDGDANMREAVLEAYLIADDAEAVLAIAEAAQTADEFEEAVQTLGAMGATEQLRALRGRSGMSEALIEAYAVAGDTDSLRELALDGSNPEQQAEAIRALAVAGGDGVDELLMQIYRDSKSPDLKEAALEAMLISGNEDGALALFRESNDPKEKRELLRLLVLMDSDAVWDIVDATLEDD